MSLIMCSSPCVWAVRAVDLDRAEAEVDADRRDIALREGVVGEAEQKTGLADARVSDEHELEQVIVVTFRHGGRPRGSSRRPGRPSAACRGCGTRGFTCAASCPRRRAAHTDDEVCFSSLRNKKNNSRGAAPAAARAPIEQSRHRERRRRRPLRPPRSTSRASSRSSSSSPSPRPSPWARIRTSSRRTSPKQ